MSMTIRGISVFLAHVVFLFMGYRSHFFGLALPYNMILAIWLGVSSLIAAAAYYWAFSRFKNGSAQVAFVVAATCASLFIGVFLAFNTYGT
jgi:hypothetical protein